MRAIHYVQLALGCVAAGAGAAIAFVPQQYVWIPSALAAVSAAVLTPLGLFADRIGAAQ